MNEPIDKGYFQDSQVEGNLGHLGLRTRHRGKKKKKKKNDESGHYIRNFSYLSPNHLLNTSQEFCLKLFRVTNTICERSKVPCGVQP